MRFPYLLLIICYSLIIGCNFAEPSFPHKETLAAELMPLDSSLQIEVKPPFIILQKKLSQTDSLLPASDSLYVKDALHTSSGLDPDMVDYYADPDMKRVYANDSYIVFCYGYKKQIDFMDFKFNLINRIKFKFPNPKYINPENQGDVNLSYVCSYLGKHYFYTLFSGISPDKQKSRSPKNSFLEVYSLRGEPIIRYYLKGKHPLYFAVDEDTFTLYGVETYDDPGNDLLVYKLNTLSYHNL